MSDSNKKNLDPLLYTTNAEDRAEAAKLVARLAESSSSDGPSQQQQQQLNHPSATITPSEFRKVPLVSLADGAHKYVLIQAQEPGSNEPVQYFVVSRRGAGYHRNVAEPTVDALEEHGYRSIQITGGGRISLDDDARKISIFGFSYGFGQADHARAKEVIQADERYHDYEITTSNEGY